MKKMLCVFLTFSVELLELAEANVKQAFDQRQVALVAIEGQDFPDDKTLAHFLDFMKQRGRLRWVTRASTTPGEFLPIKVPKDFSWQSATSVRKLGLRYKVDGVVLLIQNGVQLELRWYATTDGLPIFFEKLTMPKAQPGEDDERIKRLANWVHDMWDRIPGQGYVMERGLNMVHVEGVDEVGFKIGDQMEFYRLLEVKRHPVLKTLVSVETHLNGKGVVESLDRPFSKVKILYESNLDPIQVGDRYKVIGQTKKLKSDKNLVENLPNESTPSMVDSQGRQFFPIQSESSTAVSDVRVKKEGIFELNAGLGFSSVTHVDVFEDGTQLELSRLLAPEVRVRSQVMLKKNWALEGEVALGFVSFGAPPSQYGVESVNSGFQKVRLGTLYSFPIGVEENSAVKLNLLADWNYLSLAMAQITSNYAPTSKTYSGINFGAGLGVPIVEDLSLDLAFRRVMSAKLNEGLLTSAAVSNSNAWEFHLRFMYALSSGDFWSAQFNYYNANSDFSGSGLRAIASSSSRMDIKSLSLGYLKYF